VTKLISLNDPTSVGILAEVAQRRGDDEPLARQAAIGLGSFATPQSIDALIDLADHRDSYIREAAVRSLGRVRATKAVPVLEDLLTYPSEPVRSAAVTALGRIGGPAATSAAASALADPRWDVRHCARHALIRLGAAQELANNSARALPLRTSTHDVPRRDFGVTE
jgi:HEAT repeat protein